MAPQKKKKGTVKKIPPGQPGRTQRDPGRQTKKRPGVIFQVISKLKFEVIFEVIFRMIFAGLKLVGALLWAL